VTILSWRPQSLVGLISWLPSPFDLLTLGEHAGIRFVKPGAALAAIRDSDPDAGRR
jgi:hypothetical protein